MIVAIKAFFKALKNKEKAKKFIEDQPPAKEKEDPSHLRFLSLLQQSGRIVDFFQEDIKSFTDAQVGAAVRTIHQECQKSIEELVTLRPIRMEKEGEMVTITEEYDPSQIKLVGNVKGTPPYEGKLIHKGWVAHKRTLPKQVGIQSNEVIQPAEVEL